VNFKKRQEETAPTAGRFIIHEAIKAKMRDVMAFVYYYSVMLGLTNDFFA
jgi:hypothetical protein